VRHVARRSSRTARSISTCARSRRLAFTVNAGSIAARAYVPKVGKCYAVPSATLRKRRVAGRADGHAVVGSSRRSGCPVGLGQGGTPGAPSPLARPCACHRTGTSKRLGASGRHVGGASAGCRDPRCARFRAGARRVEIAGRWRPRIGTQYRSVRGRRSGYTSSPWASGHPPSSCAHSAGAARQRLLIDLGEHRLWRVKAPEATSATVRPQSERVNGTSGAETRFWSVSSLAPWAERRARFGSSAHARRRCVHV